MTEEAANDAADVCQKASTLYSHFPMGSLSSSSVGGIVSIRQGRRWRWWLLAGWHDDDEMKRNCKLDVIVGF